MWKVWEMAESKAIGQIITLHYLLNNPVLPLLTVSPCEMVRFSWVPLPSISAQNVISVSSLAIIVGMWERNLQNVILLDEKLDPFLTLFYFCFNLFPSTPLFIDSHVIIMYIATIGTSKNEPLLKCWKNKEGIAATSSRRVSIVSKLI